MKGWMVVSALLVLTLGASGAARAEAVAPQAIWHDGLSVIQGKFQFVQVSSPGGLWIKDSIQGAREPLYTQVSMNELPGELQAKLKNAEIKLQIVGSTDSQAEQSVAPGQRGQPPYHGHLRRYEETGRGVLTIQGLPGIGLAENDRGEFSGEVDFSLESQNHSDPSDIGIFEERFKQEMTWGPAAQLRNYADLRAHRHGATEDDSLAMPMANARLLRGGREIIAYIEWTSPNPPAGISRRVYQGSVRLYRIGN